MPQRLHTSRLTLVPVEAGDEDDLCALLWDADVRRYLCDDALLPREAVRGTIRESLDPASISAFWRIEEAGGDGVGLIGLRTPTEPMRRLRAIGWRSLELVVALAPAHWGRGLAAEAIEAVAIEAKADGVTFALLAGVDVPNARSHRLMRCCGFEELGRMQGTAHTIVVYERAL